MKRRPQPNCKNVFARSNFRLESSFAFYYKSTTQGTLEVRVVQGPLWFEVAGSPGVQSLSSPRGTRGMGRQAAARAQSWLS
jgi:hypothetical protein